MCAANARVSQLPANIAKTGGIQTDGAPDRRPQDVVLVERAGDLDRCAGALIRTGVAGVARAVRVLADRLLRPDRQPAAIDLQCEWPLQRQAASRRAPIPGGRGIGAERSEAALAAHPECVEARCCPRRSERAGGRGRRENRQVGPSHGFHHAAQIDFLPLNFDSARGCIQ